MKVESSQGLYTYIIFTESDSNTPPLIRMPSQPTTSQVRLNNIIAYLDVTAESLEILTSSLKTPLLGGISNTIKSLLKILKVALNWVHTGNSYKT